MSDQEPKNPQIAWEVWKHKHETARRAHDEHEAYGLEHFKATIAFGVEAIRTTALINGGALVASLALVGATADSAPQLAPQIIGAVLTFAIGVLCAGGAASMAYLAQFCFASGHAYVTRSWEHPYVTTRRPGKWWEGFGTGFQLIAFAAVVTSYVAVLLGASRIYRAWIPDGSLWSYFQGVFGGFLGVF